MIEGDKEGLREGSSVSKTLNLGRLYLEIAGEKKLFLLDYWF